MRNCRLKVYPDGTVDVLVGSRPFGGGSVSREPRRYDEGEDFHDGWADLYTQEWKEEQAEKRREARYEAEERDAIQDPEGRERARMDAAIKAANTERATRRARTKVRDLGRSNAWRYFVTLTLDPRRINRYDAGEVVRHLNHWLDNNVRRNGLAYVLVPERHKDGAIHFHGFFNDALKAVDSGHKDAHGHPVYNLPGWGWGFSTAIELYGERAAAVAYCCKYVSKQQEKIGGRWYYSGGALQRPTVEWCDADFDKAAAAVEGKEPFTVDSLPWTRFISLRMDEARGSGCFTI